MAEININEICREQHQRMKDKGFHDKTLEIGTQLMLVVSELGEAIEADRNGRHANIEKFEQAISAGTKDDYAKGCLFRIMVKDTFEDEIADAFLRLFDLCGTLGIDIDAHIKQKMWYNSTREVKHGKEY